MVKLLVYGYCVGVRASRKFVQRIGEDIAFRVLAADNRPDFRTLSDFPKIHLKARKALFEQTPRLVASEDEPDKAIEGWPATGRAKTRW